VTASDESTKSPPAKLPSGQFPKGKSGNPTGRPKGSLAKKTRFLQIMTQGRQQKALKVLDAILRDAEKGDKESRKIVASLLQPFLKQEAEQDGGGGGDKRPVVTVIVNQAEGRQPALPPAVRVLDAQK